MSSGVPLKADLAQFRRHFAFVPSTEAIGFQTCWLVSWSACRMKANDEAWRILNIARCGVPPVVKARPRFTADASCNARWFHQLLPSVSLEL